MLTKRKIGAALAIIALAILPAAVLFHWIALSWNALALLGVVGTFTATYASFQDGSGYYGGYTGGATAPTQAQSFGRNLVSALLAFTDTDTTFTLTHNFNLTAAQLTCLYPLVNIETAGSVQAVGTAVGPVLTITKAANTITVTKLQATGSGSTVQIDIRRPGTPGY